MNRTLLGVVAAALAVAGALVFVRPSGVPPVTPVAWAPKYQASGPHLYALGCASSPGCTADFLATAPDGGLVRVQARSDGDGGVLLQEVLVALDGGMLMVDAGSFQLLPDAGIGGLQ